MTSEELADDVQNIITDCRSRILGVGKDQYDHGTEQKFERMSVDELITWAREEAQDLVVYGAMLDIRLQRLQRTLGDHL
jgi:hypothetical protein